MNDPAAVNTVGLRELLKDHLERPATIVVQAAVCCRSGEEAATTSRIEASLDELSDFVIVNFAKGPSHQRQGSAAANPLNLEELAVLIPERGVMAASSLPLLKSERLRAVVLWSFWNRFLASSVLCGIILTQLRNLPNLTNLGDDLTSGAGLFILGVTLSMHASMYDRGLFKKLLRNFQFWYLAVQVLLGVVCMSYEAIKLSDTWLSMYVLTALRIFGDGAIVVALFGLDASSLQRKAKGVVSLLVAVTFALWAYLWRVKNSAPLDDVIDVWLWTTTPRAVLQSVFLTESAFFASYAFGALYVGHFTVMLRFLPQRLPLGRISMAGASSSSENMTSRNTIGSASKLSRPFWKIERHLDLNKRYEAVGDPQDSPDLAHGKRGLKLFSPDSSPVSGTIKTASSPTSWGGQSRGMNEWRSLLNSATSPLAARHHGVSPSVVAFSAVLLCHRGEEEACQISLRSLLQKHSSLSFACVEIGGDASDVSEAAVESLLSSLTTRQRSDVDFGDEAAQAVLHQSLAKVPSLFLHQDGRFHRWFDRRLLVPNTSAFISSSKTMLPAWDWPHATSFRHPTLWNVAIFIAVVTGASLCMCGFAIVPNTHPWLACVGSAIYAVSLACHAATFKQDMFFRLLREFEFLYLVLQSAVLGGSCAYVAYSDNRVGPVEAGVTVLLVVLWSVLQAIAVFGMDACFTRRKFKSVLSAAMCLVFFIWACVCSRAAKDASSPLNSIVNLFFVKLSLRTVSQNVLATLALFCGKYSFTTLVLGNDAVLLRFECNRFLSSGVFYDETKKMWIGSGSEIDYNLVGGGFSCHAKYLAAAERADSFS